MKKYLFNLIFLLISTLIFIINKDTVSLIICIISLIYFIVKIDKKYKIIFISTYIILILVCLINIYSNNKPKETFNNDLFEVIEVKDSYYIVEHDNQKYLIYKNDIILDEGNKLLISGKYKKIRDQGVPYLFNFNQYLRYHKVLGEIQVSELIIKDDSISIRKSIENFTLKKFKYSDDILGLIIFGNNSDSIEEFYNSLINVSVIHLFVISGFHFNFIYKAVKKVLKKEYIVFTILFFYLYLQSFAISAFKAFLYLLIKKIDEKKKFQLSNVFILSLIALLFIVINPYVIFQNSFILSFVLSYFIELLKVLTKNKKSIKSKVLFTIFPYLSVLPIVINLQEQISLFHIFIQIIISPFIPILYIISFGILLFPFLDKYYYKLYLGIESSFLFIEDNIFYINFKYISTGIIIFYYITLFLIYKYLYLKKYKKSLILTYVLCLGLFGYNYFPYNNRSIYFLDVGQGDSILIRGKNNSFNVLIDTGGNIYSDIANKVHIPLFRKLGIKHLDAVFISHNDYDHNGALESLKSKIKINYIIDESVFKYKIFKDLVIYNLNKSVISDDDNEKSQVLYFKYLSHYFLCTGDMSVKNEQILMKNYKSLKVDILKVSHHGSSTSSSKEFLDYINPKIAVISVGVNNRYNHPSSEVIERLNSKNIKIYRTDLMGTIKMEENIFNNLKIYKTILN